MRLWPGIGQGGSVPRASEAAAPLTLKILRDGLPAPVSRRGLAAVVLLQLAALLAVSVLIGDNGWDDGAITLAFSRTFAHHGLAALTSRSEVVEGFSSVSWWLLNAAVALARPSFSTAILLSQLLAALCLCGATVLLARTCALLGLERRWATGTVSVFAAWGCAFSEASNGMEMGLLAVAVLLMVNELLAPRPRLGWLAAGAVLAVTTRFEAALYVAALGGAVVTVRGRRAFWTLALSATAALLALTVWRLSVFSDVMPNTVWAKRWPPYASFGLAGRLKGALELPIFFLAPVAVLLGARLSGFVFRGGGRAARILGLPVLGAVLMGALTGEHWGYAGRMPFFAFPLGFALCALWLSSWVNAGAGRGRAVIVAGAALVSLGVSVRGFPIGSLAAAAHGGSFGVTPHTYAASGRMFARVAAAAGLPHATILTPDLGGLALAHDEFRLVDLGLLASRTLAHRGPAAIGDVLAHESPELVEAHWEWAFGLYDLPNFQSHYLPAFDGGTKLWIRRDVARAIEQAGRGCRLPTGREDVRAALRAHRYADHDLPADRAAFERPGVVFALNQADAPGGNLCQGAGR